MKSCGSGFSFSEDPGPDPVLSKHLNSPLNSVAFKLFFAKIQSYIKLWINKIFLLSLTNCLSSKGSSKGVFLLSRIRSTRICNPVLLTRRSFTRKKNNEKLRAMNIPYHFAGLRIRLHFFYRDLAPTENL